MQITTISRLHHEFAVDLKNACKLSNDQARTLLRLLCEGSGAKGAVELAAKNKEIKEKTNAQDLDAIADEDLPCNDEKPDST